MAGGPDGLGEAMEEGTADQPDAVGSENISEGEVPTNPSSPGVVVDGDPFQFNVEELMKRRLVVQEEVAAEVARPESLKAESALPPPPEEGTLSSLLMGYGDSDDEEQSSVVDNELPAEENNSSLSSKPKTACVDPMVRSLVPASVLHKRQHSSVSSAPSKLKKNIAQHLEKPKETMDDDFNSFMSEISNMPT